MKYSLQILPEAKPEWSKLNPSVKKQLEKKLREVLEEPIRPNQALTGGLIGHYKIKIKRPGYRIIYRVEQDQLVVVLIAAGKREDIYDIAKGRL